MNRPNGALAGLRVLDLTRVLAGPFCTMMLADMGAEVIKIEQPGRGDDTRHFAPFKNGESAYYMNLNRGKQGVTNCWSNDDSIQVPPLGQTLSRQLNLMLASSGGCL